MDEDRDSNVAWNRERWGQPSGWSDLDHYGYSWDGRNTQQVGQVAAIADAHLAPFLSGRRDLVILELSPGGGRFTAELIRYARRMILVDLTQAAIDACAERFRFYPTPMELFTNDGLTLPMVASESIDLLACYDSMVHMHPDVIASYVSEAARVLAPGGIAWLDHSGKGERRAGHRTAMTAEKMADLAARYALTVVDQRFRNDWDCISVLRKG